MLITGFNFLGTNLSINHTIPIVRRITIIAAIIIVNIVSYFYFLLKVIRKSTIFFYSQKPMQIKLD
ncbi:hypothetical protein GCM10009431_18490 [Gaetbulibacter jejuensis]|uniref:Uncharacterized protein n=1 Tax=Gaetbulibacter jejuensis TaxID=584607 RepID=A0ABN1JQ35_9FLAO